MFLLRSATTPTHRPPTLNALTKPTDDQATRRARHLRSCEELAELGMQLARAAHGEALRDLQPPTVRTTPVPGLPGYTPPGVGDARAPTFGQLFSQLARCVRQTMLLEARLAAGTFDRPIAPPSPANLNPAPARPRPTDETPRLRPEQFEDEAAADANRAPAEIIADICAEFSAALDSGLSPKRATQKPNRPIPAPPPAREAPLTGLERSAMQYFHQRASPFPRGGKEDLLS